MNNLWRRCRTQIFRTTHVGVLVLVSIATLLSNTSTVQAQVTYTEYTNLFKGTNPAPSLTLYSLFKTENGTTTPDVKFNLQMSFRDIPSVDTGPAKTAAWAKIKDFSSSSRSFILRICDVEDTTETNCLFSVIPHKRVPASASNVDLPGVLGGLIGGALGTPQLGTVLGAPSSIPPSTTQPTGSIFHYQYTTTFSADMQNDKFNVLFPVASLFGVDQNGSILTNNINGFIRIGDQRTFRADAWYCAQGSGVPTQGDPSNPNFRMFNNICGDNRPYFKIATSAPFRMPQSATEAAAQVPGTITPVDTAPTQSTIPGCGVTPWSEGSLMGCIAQVAYYLIYRPIAWFAGLMGNLFDFFLGYSLSDASYRAEFAVRGWQIVRDICNIFFVIILVWVGLMTVFKTSSYNPKKVLATLVINALLINFSLFATRVIIDISNIVARVFYHAVEVCDGPCQKDSQGVVQNPKNGIAGYTPLSEKIVSSFNPQKIFSEQFLDSTTALPDNGTAAQGASRKLSTSDNEYGGYYLVVSLIAAFILFAIAMMFWKTAFFFLGRVIGLYIAMIFSPFAFLARDGVPIVGNIKKLSWNTWLGDLIKYATLAPIFVFFLYVIYSFLETDFLKVYQDRIGTNFFETVVYIAIPMLIVYFMINQGVKIAEEYAGDFGKQVQGFAQKATGFVGGVALGGAGLVGGRVIGGLATSLNKSKAGEWLRDKGKSTGMGGWLARRSINTLNSAEKTSFDVRKTGLGQKLFKEMGVDTDQKALSALSGVGLGFGTSSTAGGYQGQVERYQKKQEAESKLLESKQNQGDIDAYNEKQRKEYQDKVEAVIEEKMNTAYGKTQVANWKANNPQRYEQERQTILKMQVTQTAINSIEKPQEKRSVQEMNAERKDKFAENLKKGGALDNFLGEDSLIGAAFGANTRLAANKKAAKKVSESAKIEKDLTEINSTLKDGFRELVAMDKLKNDRLWTTNLTATQRTALMRGEKITFTNRAGQQVEGGFYDYVKDQAPSTAGAIDIEVGSAENNKDKKKELLDQIKTRQQFKFDFKTLNNDIKQKEQDYANNPNQTNLDALNKLKAQRVKMKNEQKKWQDLDKYIEEQKKKLEGKE